MIGNWEKLFFFSHKDVEIMISFDCEVHNGEKGGGVLPPSWGLEIPGQQFQTSNRMNTDLELLIYFRK